MRGHEDPKIRTTPTLTLCCAAACTVLTFAGSMLWMNAAADELVGLLMAVGAHGVTG